MHGNGLCLELSFFVPPCVIPHSVTLRGRIYALSSPRLTVESMESLAATGAKHKLRRFGSHNSRLSYGDGAGPRDVNGGTSVRSTMRNTLNEHTRLLDNVGHNAQGQPLYEDSRPWVGYPSSFAHTTYETLKSNYVNVLLVFVPLGIIAGAVGWNPTAVFILNFLAIIPLASLLSFATEEVSVKLGQTLGGLLNASFGNAVELIVSITGVAFRKWSNLVPYRLALSPSRTMKSGSSSRPCLDQCYPIFFWSWAAASSLGGSARRSRSSTLRWLLPCHL